MPALKSNFLLKHVYTFVRKATEVLFINGCVFGNQHQCLAEPDLGRYKWSNSIPLNLPRKPLKSSSK